jgi:threonine dehydrogenase-like Zn-dependent dehydrogenase
VNVFASVTSGIGHSAVREFPLPDIGADAGLLRVEAAGVCGSDVNSYRRNATPRIMGHENVGVIEQIGELAAQRWGVTIGDRVALEEYLPCGHCRYCRTSEFRLCFETDPRMSGGVRYGSTGIDVVPSLWGGYSQYLYLHPRSVLHSVPASVPAELLTLALPLGNGFEWATVLGGAAPGKLVGVFGPGQQGLACMLAAKAAGADLVVGFGLDRDSRRLEVARALGADHTVDVSKADPVEVVRDLTGGQLLDVVIDTAAGSRATLVPAVDMLRHTGTLVVPAGNSDVDGFPIGKVRQKFLTVRGARGHGYSSVTWAINLIAAQRLPLELMTTHRVGLDRVDYAIRSTGGEFGPDAIHAAVEPWR